MCAAVGAEDNGSIRTVGRFNIRPEIMVRQLRDAAALDIHLIKMGRYGGIAQLKRKLEIFLARPMR